MVHASRSDSKGSRASSGDVLVRDDVCGIKRSVLVAQLLITFCKAQIYIKESEKEQLLHKLTRLKPEMNKVSSAVNARQNCVPRPLSRYTSSRTQSLESQ